MDSRGEEHSRYESLDTQNHLNKSHNSYGEEEPDYYTESEN